MRRLKGRQGGGLLVPRGLERGARDEAVQVGLGLRAVFVVDANHLPEEDRVSDADVRDGESAPHEVVAAVVEGRVEELEARVVPFLVVLGRAYRYASDVRDSEKRSKRRDAPWRFLCGSKSRYRRTSVWGKVRVASAWKSQFR